MTTSQSAAKANSETAGVKLRQPQITLEEIEARIRRTNFVCYGANTCWWGDSTYYFRPIPGKPNDPGLPCDPRGGMLFQIDGHFVAGGERHDPLAFIRKAQENPSFYGRHGIRAFIAAFDGNVLTEDGKHTCLRDWEDYNALLDEATP